MLAFLQDGAGSSLTETQKFRTPIILKMKGKTGMSEREENAVVCDFLILKRVFWWDLTNLL